MHREGGDPRPRKELVRRNPNSAAAAEVAVAVVALFVVAVEETSVESELWFSLTLFLSFLFFYFKKKKNSIESGALALNKFAQFFLGKTNPAKILLYNLYFI